MLVIFMLREPEKSDTYAVGVSKDLGRPGTHIREDQSYRKASNYMWNI